MSLKNLINEHFSEQPKNNISTSINNKSPSIDIDGIVKENIACDVQDVCCDLMKVDMVDKLPIQQTTKDYDVSGLLKIELLIPYSVYNIGGFYYVMKYGDVKEIPMNKAIRLIEQGFAMKAT